MTSPFYATKLIKRTKLSKKKYIKIVLRRKILDNCCAYVVYFRFCALRFVSFTLKVGVRKRNCPHQVISISWGGHWRREGEVGYAYPSKILPRTVSLYVLKIFSLIGLYSGRLSRNSSSKTNLGSVSLLSL
jgi:hypothetical protein